jgi:glycosyltransferase involved in cell wall biosynthesis
VNTKSVLGLVPVPLRRLVRRLVPVFFPNHRFSRNLVSIVIPVYNCEDWLEESVISAVKQSHRYIEVIVINDGSTDGSALKLRSLKSKFARVNVFNQSNSGLSMARNAGVIASRGRFIWFLDGDDILERTAIGLAFDALRVSGSCFTVAPYRMLHPGGELKAPGRWISEAHKTPIKVTRIENYPDILVNQIACNRLIRKSFWEECGFAFPKGVTYEDQYVVTEMYLKAYPSFDVLSQPALRWRKRGDSSSITDQVSSVDNMRAKNFAAEVTLDLLKATNVGLYRVRIAQLLSTNSFVLSNLYQRDNGALWDELNEFLPKYMEEIDLNQLVPTTKIEDRVIYALIAINDRGSALKLLESTVKGLVNENPLRLADDNSVHVDLSSLIGESANSRLPGWATRLPDSIFQVVARLTSLELMDRSWRFHGFAYLANIIESHQNWRLQVSLKRPDGTSVSIPIMSEESPHANKLSATQKISYLNSRFYFDISSEIIENISKEFLLGSTLTVGYDLEFANRKYSGLFYHANDDMEQQLRDKVVASLFGVTLGSAINGAVTIGVASESRAGSFNSVLHEKRQGGYFTVQVEHLDNLNLNLRVDSTTEDGGGN